MEASKSIKLGVLLICVSAMVGLWQGSQELKESKENWSLQLDKNDIIEDDGLMRQMLKLQHQTSEIPQQVEVHIQKNDDTVHKKPLDLITNFSIQHFIEIEKESIKNIFLNSSKKLNVKVNGRLLSSIEKGKPFFKAASTLIQTIMSLCRNLAFIAIVTNSFSTWMPLLLFIETFMMVGFWTHDVHYISKMYIRMFNSKIDGFNLLRMMFSRNPTESKIGIINDYGYSNKFFANISGQFSVLLLLFVGSIAIKSSNIFIKSQKIRALSSKIRPVWNGYICWMTPKLLTMAGLQFRGMTKTPSGADIINCLLAAVAIIAIIIYIVMLIMQVRRINSKLEYIEESRHQIGMAGRIDYLRDFEFDCLQYSMLYYPVMNQIRLTFSFLCNGFAPDFHHIQFGGVLAGQVFYLMMQISCSPYIKTKDKVLYPILDFLYAVYLLFVIGLGLIYEVEHFELTIKLQTFLFIVLLMIIFPLTLSIGHDAFISCKQSRIMSEDDREQEKSSEDLDVNQKKTQKKSQVKQNKKKNMNKSARKNKEKEGKQQKGGKATNKNFKAEDLSESQEQQSDKTQNIFSQDKKVRIKKIKKGKVI